MTLMEQLPRGEVATKQSVKADLDALEQRMDVKTEAMEHRLLAAFYQEIGGQIGSLRTDLSAQLVVLTRTFVFATIGAVGTVGALAFAAGMP